MADPNDHGPEGLRKSRQHLAIALDEVGGLHGVVVLDDLVEAVVGELPVRDEAMAVPIERRDDQARVVEGSVLIEDLEAALDLTPIPVDERGGVRTLGGFVMAALGRVSAVGDVTERAGLRLQVESMDGRRIDRVVLTKIAHRAPVDRPSSVPDGSVGDSDQAR